MDWEKNVQANPRVANSVDEVMDILKNTNWMAFLERTICSEPK
jgi:hypothetical protein